jgi:hypothetical protein
MEHRYTERKPLDLSVVVNCPRVGLFRGRIRDLSLGGMYIECDCVVMPIHAPVTVSFQPDPDDPSAAIEASGMVVHQRGNAFGLMFEEHNPAVNGALRELLGSLSPPFGTTSRAS